MVAWIALGVTLFLSVTGGLFWVGYNHPKVLHVLTGRTAVVMLFAFVLYLAVSIGYVGAAALDILDAYASNNNQFGQKEVTNTIEMIGRLRNLVIVTGGVVAGILYLLGIEKVCEMLVADKNSEDRTD